MIKIVGVRFRNAGKVYYFNPKDFTLRVGDHVIVETSKGPEYGVITTGCKMVADDQVAQESVLFRADTAADAGAFYQALFAFKGGLTVAGDVQFWCVFALAVIFSFLTLVPFGQRLQDRIFADSYSKPLSWTMFAITLVLFILSAGSLCVSDFNPFIYFRF